VRAVLTVFAIALLVLVTTVDRVACPDGCTDEQASHAGSSAPSACGLCHGWSGPEPVKAVEPGARSIVLALAFDRVPHAAHPPTIDHPPRLA
jgi:hypothetical protein